MNINMELREFAVQLLASAEKIVRGTQLESLAVAQVEPRGLELTRTGRRFLLGYSAAPTGIAPVQTLPTTAAQWAIQNNEPAGTGRTYFMERLGMYLTSGTPGVGGVLLGCVFQTPVTTAGTAGAAVANANGSSAIGSRVVVKSAVTITAPAAPVWTVLASNPSPNVGAFPGSATFDSGPLEGRIAVPPQYSLGLAVLALAGTTPLWAPFGEWVEIETVNR